MTYEGSWNSFGRDFTPVGEVKTAAEVQEPDPSPLSLTEVLEERLLREGRLEDFREKTAGLRIDGPIESRDIEDLAVTVEKIGVAVERRERADQSLVDRFVRRADLLNRSAT